MLVKWKPFGSLIDPDAYFDSFLNTGFAVRSTSFEPKVDIRETEKNFEINAELPGLDKKDFKLTLEDDFLTLEGEKKFENEEKGDDFYRSERSFGAFKRSFRLTDAVDKKKIKADFNNGILNITLPKSKKVEPKEIEIGVN